MPYFVSCLCSEIILNVCLSSSGLFTWCLMEMFVIISECNYSCSFLGEHSLVLYVKYMLIFVIETMKGINS